MMACRLYILMGSETTQVSSGSLGYSSFQRFRATSSSEIVPLNLGHTDP